MIVKLLFTIIVFIICTILYFKFRENEHSLGFLIVTGLISAILVNILIPTNISIFDIFNYTEQTSEDAQTNNAETFSPSEEEFISDENESIPDNMITKEPEEMPEETPEEAPEEISTAKTELPELTIPPLNSLDKNINNIADNLLEIEPIALNYLEGNITSDDQLDTYTFIPPVDGTYRFETTDMLGGVKINLTILNQTGESEDETSYGIENGEGLTIDNMVANETYTIQVEQYSSYSPYKILLGPQKNIVNIDGNINQVTDSIQYTDQQNIYRFTPPLNGRYRFELDEMISGTKVNLIIRNPGGEIVDETSYGIENGEGLTIDNMIGGETYCIYITQYRSYVNYKLLIGYQKETVQLNGETEISDSIQYNAQLNQYQFTPQISGRYRFEISDIISGAKVNMAILNQSGGEADSTSYGISNHEGLTVDDMVAGETYTIQIIQYNSYSPYKLNIGYQKQPVQLNVNSVSDTIQYTQQQNIYYFSPQSDGNYTFIIDDMVSGMKINISLYNEGGECIDETSYGTENGDELLIENMIKDETYTIYITQYEGDGSYLMVIK